MGANAIWKIRAREALRDHWLTALLIALIVNLPSLLVQGIAAATENDLMTRLTELVYSSVSTDGTAVDAVRLAAGMESLAGSTGIWVMQGLNLAAWLLTPCLSLGMTAWLLGRLRGQEDPGVTGVFSRMNLFFKGIGLRLYVSWRIFLWMLPGAALMILAFLPLWLSDTSSRISVLSAANTVIGLQSAAMIVMTVLGVMAALKYALADSVMADGEIAGPIRAAKESKRMTLGKKGQIFSLYVSFILWYILETLVTGFCQTAFGTVPALMVQMLASLAISVYLTASVCAFYLDCRGERAPEKSGEEEETEWME